MLLQNAQRLLHRAAVVADATMISRSATTSRNRTKPVASVQISAMTSAKLTGLLRLISTMNAHPPWAANLQPAPNSIPDGSTTPDLPEGV